MVRKDLAKFVQENQNDQRIRLALINNIADEELPNQTLEEKIETYIKKQFTDGFWGGEDILIAAAEYYLVNVHIIQENTNRITYCPLGPPVQGNIYLLFSGNHYDSIVTLQTQDRYDSQNTQKSPQSSNRPSQIASLPTTYRTALAIYEDWGLDSKLLLLGDFNAHIGRDDNRGTKKLVVGYNLFHPTSNHLGSFLLDFCEQHNLVISSTWGRRSCKRTLEVQQNKSKTSRLALAKFMKAKFWKNRSPKDPATIQNFKDARKELLDLQEKEDEEKCQHFSHRCTKFVDPNE
ncbi:hypothetical protein EVAR_31449_1 [Eumeta japonica]|uniref:Uncharacterized protein n=1 Tax=Eumeta variegata TaxID=151549 RepID=A0A4C1UXU5_EUMVA|nr:hypothetical protein EVAR_31449_1 [Eumeta japonica]